MRKRFLSLYSSRFERPYPRDKHPLSAAEELHASHNLNTYVLYQNLLAKYSDMFSETVGQMSILLKLLSLALDNGDSLALDNGDDPSDFVNQFRLLQVCLRKLSPDLADHDVLLQTILFNNVQSDEMDKVRDKLQTESDFDLTKRPWITSSRLTVI